MGMRPHPLFQGGSAKVDFGGGWQCVVTRQALLPICPSSTPGPRGDGGGGCGRHLQKQKRVGHTSSVGWWVWVRSAVSQLPCIFIEGISPVSYEGPTDTLLSTVKMFLFRQGFSGFPVHDP